MQNFLNEHKVISVLNRMAGTTATTILTDPIDMTGFDSVAAIILFSSTAPASAGITAHFQHGVTSTGFVTTTTNVTSNGPLAAKTAVIDIQKVSKLKARFKLNPDHTDAIPIGGVVAVLYNAGQRPVVQSDNVAISVEKIDPTS